jgi:phospholipid/cholesterol/gamma-HCH transport system substrate-binding protein
METRAHYLLIGSFVLAMFVGLLAFIIWLAKINIDREFAYYDIYFNDSVAGLSVGGDVRYNGIQVGVVKKISIDPKVLSRVRVTVKIAGDTPIREDSVAYLDFQGLTGVSFVQIEGGSVQSAPLKVHEGEEFPVIHSRSSPIQELFTDAPDLVNQATMLVGEISRLFSKKNRDAVAATLHHIEVLTGGLAQETDSIRSAMRNLDATLVEMRAAAASIDQLAQRADGVVDQDLRGLLAEARGSARSITELADSLKTLVKDNGAPITAFTTTTLPEVSRFVIEARRLAATLSRMAERLEADPSSLVFSPGKPEFEAK